MFRCVWMTVLLLAIGASTLHAQLVVIDPANLAQTVLIASRTERHYEELVAEFRIIQRMAQGLAGLDRYRIPAIAITGHDPPAHNDHPCVEVPQILDQHDISPPAGGERAGAAKAEVLGGVDRCQPDRQHRVEEVSQANTLGLGDEAE